MVLCRRKFIASAASVAGLHMLRAAGVDSAAANAANFGHFPTHRRRKLGLTPAIDNVFVRGLRIVEVCLGDYALSLSDHRPLAVRLAPSPIPRFVV